jgi:hypothetical protein
MSLPLASETANKKNHGRVVLWSIIALIVGLLVGHMATYHMMHHHRFAGFTTPYQAVLLINGTVYYGKLSGYGSRNPVLTDVFYIVSKTDPETKQTTNILVKRGKELHEPDRMYLTSSDIVFVEPVGPQSKVAQLIDQASK